MACSGGSETTNQDDSLQNETTISRLRLMESPSGFWQFLVNLKSFLTRERVRTLVTAFDFKPVDIDKVESSEDPGYIFINLLREKDIINSSDISVLISKFEACDVHGVDKDINTSFRQYQSGKSLKMTLPKSLDAKTIFIRELTQKYEDLYLAVKPIPYIRDRLFCVDKVFVEGGIEYLASNDLSGRAETWCELSSYKDIFHDMKIQSVRRIIEGEPGFGKSTLTLQIAYDWCKGTPNSVSSKYELLILLQLKQFGGETSIFRAIKELLLSPDCSLSEVDIQQILKDIKSVLVIFDGFDEYPDRDSKVASEVKKTIRRDMFKEFDVVLTTRTGCLPKDPAPQTKRIRLTGFDNNSRDEYIRKAVVGNDEEAGMIIKCRLQENPVLADLCQMPQFFAMYAHMSHENKTKKQTFKSVTGFFRYMIWCFHHHLKNKAKDDNVQKYSSFEGNHHRLDKVAFEGLSKANQQLVWERDSLRERLGQDFYDHYVRLGILVEEEVLDIKSDSPADTDLVPQKTKVRFYHKLFCEWYAAHFLSKYVERDDVRYVGSGILINIFHMILGTINISNVLQNLDPFDHQYVFRFACGLNPDASEKIIEYVKNKQNAHNFAVLCILEAKGDIHNIVDSVRDICSKTVRIALHDTLLQRRSTIQLLEVAAKNGISISRVRLTDCYSTVNLSGGNHMQLNSNLSIPVLTTLKKLTVDEEGREITAEEVAGILQYSSKCLALKELWFWYCLLPQSVQAESVSVLRSRNVKVAWWAPAGYDYQLNLQSCLWERLGGGVMTDEDYQEEVSKFWKVREAQERRQRSVPK